MWVTDVVLQTLLNKYKLESLQGDGSRTRQAIPQNARWKARVCNCCFLVDEFSLYSNYLAQSSFLFGVGTAFPHLFFLHYSSLCIHLRQRIPGSTCYDRVQRAWTKSTRALLEDFASLQWTVRGHNVGSLLSVLICAEFWEQCFYWRWKKQLGGSKCVVLIKWNLFSVEISDNNVTANRAIILLKYVADKYVDALLDETKFWA